jgi:uncharacterized protein
MTAFDLLIAALGVLSGAVAAIAGFGIGSLLTPALAITFGTKAAVAIVALPHAVATATRLWVLRGAVDRRVLLSFGLPSAAGGLAGALLHAAVSSPLLSVVLGLLLVFAGASELSGLAGRLRFPGPTAIVAGVLSGLFGGLVGNQGGIRSAALLRFDLSREALVATATASALLVDAARVPIYLATAGPEIARAWPTIAVLTVAVIAGTFLGAPVLRRLPDSVFRRLLAILLIVLGVSLVVAPGP